ncbi:MAG TPA: tetratricopeptide repeat protein [Longimicrobiaceae bacterium]|nr:tetratricopeptide repeat protein [Longimicrobiaceae bacterium]
MSESRHRWSELLKELKRRRVVRVAVGYVGAVFVLLQGVQILTEASLLPGGLLRALVLLALFGLPVALVTAWIFDVTSEGLRLTGRAGSAGRLVARFNRRGLLLVFSTVLVAGLAAVALARRSGAGVDHEIFEEGEAVAILPFTTSGEGLRGLEQGLVDLLSRSLNGVGDIRITDPRAVLARWNQATADGHASFAEKLALAAETNSSSLLTGSIVAIGPNVRISADLFSLDGTRIGEVQVDGTTRDVLSLVDSLSLSLLREILSSSKPLPEVDVSAITSSNMEAIRAFLAGERFYRASAWNRAVASFTEATTKDSLFALAFYRLASTAGWTGDEGLRARSIARALRLQDRLPARERILIRAEALRRNGNRAAAIDTLSAYLERYPADPEATFLMADDLFHLQYETAPLSGSPAEDALWLFDRTLTLDPTFTPAVIHPMEVAFRSRNSALARRYLQENVRRASSAHPEAVRIYSDALAALEQPRNAELVRTALLRAVSAVKPGLTDFAFQASRSVLGCLVQLAARLPAEEREELASALRSKRAAEQGSASRALFELYVSTGEIEEARTVLRRASIERTINRQSLRELAYLPVLAGYTTTPVLPATSDFAPPPAIQAATLLLQPLDRSDPVGVREALRRIAVAGLPDTVLLTALTRTGGGFLRVLEGDTVNGLREVESALADAGFRQGTILEALWLRWLEHSVRHPETRDQAIAILEKPWPGQPIYDVLRSYLLAEGLAAAGRTGEAAQAYAHFATALSEADPLPSIQARLRRATRGLQRVGMRN